MVVYTLMRVLYLTWLAKVLPVLLAKLPPRPSKRFGSLEVAAGPRGAVDLNDLVVGNVS